MLRLSTGIDFYAFATYEEALEFSETIPAFLAPDAPENRLDILRGLA